MKEYFDDAITFHHLYKGLKKCCKNVRWKDSVIGYEANGLKNTYNLRQDLLSGKYKISPYQIFVIHEPKTRTIVATRIRDRQFQRALCDNGFMQDMTEHFLIDNPACQKGKGTDFTLNRMTAHLRRYFNTYGREGWVLKCDIHHFFPSTPHEVAKAAVLKRVEDERAYKAIAEVIDSFENGLGLGSEISQLVELAVLDNLDHYIKEKLRIKHYLRYMDDFILVHPDRDYLIFCKSEIEKHLHSIGLELNAKTKIYPLRQGVQLMKWRFVITETGKIKRFMSKEKLGRQRRKIRKIVGKEARGELPNGTAKISTMSWCANAKRGDTYFQQKRMREFYYETKGCSDYGNHNRSTEAGEDGGQSSCGEVAGRGHQSCHRLQHHDGEP